MRMLRAALVALALLAAALSPAAADQSFPSFVGGRATATAPYTGTDYLPLVRDGTTYKLPGTALLSPGSNDRVTVNGIVCPLGGSCTVPSSRNVARLQAQWIMGAVVNNGTVYLSYKMPYSGTVDSLDYFSGAGSFVVSIQINGVPVTGLSSVTVSSPTAATSNATGANTFNAGDAVTAVISGASSSPTNALINLNVSWN